MARRKRSKGASNSLESVAAPGLASPLATIQLSAPMGVSNIQRGFFASQHWNTPHLVLKRHTNVFQAGWSASEGPSSQDYDAARDTTADPDSALYPITPPAEAFASRHWPLLNALLQSGVGTRYPAELNHIVRYYAMTATCLQRILFPLQLNYLASAFPWAALPPYTETVPPAVWGLAELFEANDIGVSDIWKPIYDRLATKVLPPRFSALIFEAAFPYIGHPSAHTVRLTTPSQAYSVITSWNLGDYINDILELLDYLEDELAQTHNTLGSFLPWRVGPPMAMFKGYDPIYEDIDYNSNIKAYNNFGDTGDPDESHALVCGTATDNGDALVYYHKGVAPLVKAVMNTPIWEVTSDLDDTFVNLTWGSGGDVCFIDDDLNLITYNGATIASAEALLYRGYYPNRWMAEYATLPDFGRGKVGLLAATIAKEEVIRLSGRYGSLLFGDDQLKQVLAITGGSSVRTISKIVADVWTSSMR